MSKLTKEDREPVLIVMDKQGYLVRAGKPECMTKKEALDYVTKGYTMKTITIAAYRKKKWKWIYDKKIGSALSDGLLVNQKTDNQ